MYAVLNFLDQFTVLIWIDLGLTLVQRLQGFNHISKHRQQNRQLFLSLQENCPIPTAGFQNRK
jgi:hypothetical protein